VDENLRLDFDVIPEVPSPVKFVSIVDSSGSLANRPSHPRTPKTASRTVSDLRYFVPPVLHGTAVYLTAQSTICLVRATAVNSVVVVVIVSVSTKITRISNVLVKSKSLLNPLG